MHRRFFQVLFPVVLLAFSVSAEDQDLDGIMRRGELRSVVRDRTDGALLNEAIAVEQAAAQARTRSDYGLELRPSVSDSDVGVGLRVYLPDRWSKRHLREQLSLVAQSEQLRVAALEWQEVMAVYRDFCSFRMLQKKLALLDRELEYIEPYLAEADRGVQLSQLALSERARLYSSCLALLNDRNAVEDSLIDVEHKLRLVLGHDADLESLSATATVAMPSQMEVETLFRKALETRADYRQLGVDARSMALAEAAARSEDGFRLKYLQPTYSVDHGNGSDSWELAAAIVLPWGTRNPDIAVYQRQQALSVAAISQQQRLIEGQLRVLLGTANDYYARLAKRNRRMKPLLEQLNSDLGQMKDVPLEQVRDHLSIRERMLETALQAAESDGRMERLAVDVVQELGGW